MTDILIVLALVVLNGAFALGELAVVSSRRPRLQALAQAGHKGARRALELAGNPGRFLSTVQIGITFVALLEGAFAGDAISDHLAVWLGAEGLSPVVAHIAGFLIGIVLVTYLSLVLGELVPKQLALRHPETIAAGCAPVLAVMTWIVSPLAAILDLSTRAVFRLIGQSQPSTNHVSEEEIRAIITEAEHAGVLEADERRMIAGVLRLGDRTARAIMTPRTDVDMVDLDDPREEITATLTGARHSRLPVHRGNPDEPLGVIQPRRALAALMCDPDSDIAALVMTAPIVQDTSEALDVLSVLQQEEVPMALVHDEYGHFEGVVTPSDVLSAIAGAFRANMEPSDPESVEAADGSWTFSGAMAVDDMADRLAIALPEDRRYHTVAGFVLSELRHLPRAGEAVIAHGWRFEVIRLDGRRIERVRVLPVIATQRRRAG